MCHPLIEVDDLSKSYGGPPVVDGLSFTVSAGRITGFLGPNGAGKSTTMRCMVGLDRPDKGQVTFGGIVYQDLPRPASMVGCVFDGVAAHPNRRAIDHLRWVAAAQGLDTGRAARMLDEVGLASAARVKVAKFSLGMRQRLALATSLLGDPRVLLLDEPLNGLDPDGVYWMRGLLASLAEQGRAILVSSHLLAEMALTADALVVIGDGHLLAAGTLDELVDGHGSLESAYLALTRTGGVR